MSVTVDSLAGSAAPLTPVHMHPAVALLEWAAVRSYCEDIRTPQVLQALMELERMAHYTAPFAAYRRALELDDPQARWTATLNAFALITGALDIKKVERALQTPVVVDASNSFRFLINEIEAGLLFADIALKTGGNPQRSQECAAHARKAYQAVIRFKDRAKLCEKSAIKVGDGMIKLRAALLDLDIFVSEDSEYGPRNIASAD